MNLKSLTDQSLLESTLQLVQRERELLSDILHHLREIERRRLFSQLGYKSLFDYATKKLGYADDQAMRRISAMRLLGELPELEEKIESGAVSLTNLSMAQTFFRQERKNNNELGKAQKLEILSALENKSKREAEGVLTAQSSAPEKMPRDRVRSVGKELAEYRFVSHIGLQTKVDRLKGLLAHSQSSLSMGEIMEIALELAIEKLDPAQKQIRKTTAPAPDIKRRGSEPRKKLPQKIRREVWRKAESQCQCCGSVYALEVDHIQPLALGGTHDLANLRLLCRACNQREAIVKLGGVKMERYLTQPSSRSD